MIKTMDQAVQVQARRYKAGKQGWARSVRRFFKRACKDPKTGKVDWYATNEMKQAVPVYFEGDIDADTQV